MRRIRSALALVAVLLPAFPAGGYAQGLDRGFGAGKSPAAARLTGARRALVIGISIYAKVTHLQFAADDARAFAAFLQSPAGGSVPAANIHLLLDSAAGETPIREGLNWLLDVSQAGDEAIIYFAGHGDVEPPPRKEVGYLLAFNARAGRDYSSEGAVEVRDVLDKIDDIVARRARVILITDACRSGTLVTGLADDPSATAGFVREKWTDVATLVSSRPNQLSQEGLQWDKHGVFTYYLIRGLNGLADTDSDGVVTLEEAARFVRDSVKRATGDNQIPTRSGDLERPASWLPVAAAGVRSPAGVAAPAAESPDSAVEHARAAFDKALNAGALMEPDSANAWFAYRQLQTAGADGTILAQARGDLREALQEDAQQVVTEYMEGGDAQPDARRLRRAANELALADALMPKTSARAAPLRARRLFLEGYAYLQKGDYATALTALRESIMLEPKAYASNALGLAFLATNQRDSARQAFVEARNRAPRRAYPLLGLALVALDGGEAAPALAVLDSAATLTEPQALLQLVRALALLDLGRKAETVAAFRRARALDPRVIDEAYLQSLLSYSPGILARVPRLRAAVR
jgi:Flp pilus assembly protein TadD